MPLLTVVDSHAGEHAMFALVGRYAAGLSTTVNAVIWTSREDRAFRRPSRVREAGS